MGRCSHKKAVEAILHMLRDEDVRDAADVLIASYGSKALVEAQRRSQDSKTKSDLISATNWARVAELIFRNCDHRECHHSDGDTAPYNGSTFWLN